MTVASVSAAILMRMLVGGEPPPPPVVDFITFVAGGGTWGGPLIILFRSNPDYISRQPGPLHYPVHRKQHHPYTTG